MLFRSNRRPLCVACWATAIAIASCIAISGLAAHSHGQEKLPDGLTVVAIDASPQKVELSHPLDYRQLLLVGTLDDGQQVDLTRIATLTIGSDAASGEAQVASVSDTRLVTPVTDGSTVLSFKYGDLAVSIPVSVSGMTSIYEPGFVKDIQPAISRMGCNAGTCHGSKDGKNGFKLSLRGYDAIYDYRAFTDDIGARRFNRAAPDQSLMLLKSSGAIPHVGGGLTQPGERYYELLRRWIANGVSYDGDTAPKVTRIEISPTNPFVPRSGLRQQITVEAHYSDGTKRDVTQEAFIESGNIEVLEAEKGGIVRLLRRGEAPVLVRYEGAYAATTLTVMGDRSGFEWQETPEFNFVDTHVYNKLRNVKILPSEICTDAEYIRRVYLDLTGIPPSAEVVRAFLADERDTQVKRAELVEQLLGSNEFIEFWTNKWSDLLQVNRKFLGETGAVALRDWIKQSVAENKPYDQFAYEIITASGSTVENPPAAYYKVLRDPVDIMENTTHLFLAVRFNCNKCHDHPFERWTQDQYYELAAYFGRVKLKEDPVYSGMKIGGSAVEGAKPLVEVVYDAQQGEVKHDRTGVDTAPQFPYTHEDMPTDDVGRRQQLAYWLTSDKNPYFARTLVNRLWGYMFGIGIIEPIDDVRAGNPATNPELLDALEANFIASDFDIQDTLRVIMTSRTYQHSYRTNRWNEDDTLNYSHAIPRRLPAEVLFDAIHVSTGAPLKIQGVPQGFRAAQLPDSGIKVPFLDDFGKPPRESACECERSGGMVLGPIMKLVNGPTVATAIQHPENAITSLVASTSDDRELVEAMFLRFLARYPTEQEIALGLEAIELAGVDFDENLDAIAAYQARIPELQAAWETNLARQIKWDALTLGEFGSQVGAEFAVADDGSVRVSGENGKDVYTFQSDWDGASLTGIRLEAMQDESLPAGGPGRAKNGNFVLNEFTVTAISKVDPNQSRQLKLRNAVADFSQSSWAVVGAVDGNAGTGWAVSPQFNKTHTAIFEVDEGELYEGGTILKFSMSQQFNDGAHSLGKFRLAATTSAPPLGFTTLDPAIAGAVATPKDSRTPEQLKRLRDEYLKSDRVYASLTQALESSRREKENPRLAGMQDLAWALINNPAFLFNR